MTLLEEVSSLEEEMIKDRRYLHQSPELSGQEYETTEFIRKALKQEELEVENLDIPTGLSVLIRGGKPGKTVCIRHDIDALPVQEETNLPFSSFKKGVSHACGHDIHIVIALYCAKILSRHRKELAGNVRIVFQPSEENISGAKQMVKAGIMDMKPKNDVVIGLHTHPDTTVGNICLKKGPMEAGVDFFQIRVKGVAGHGAYPHKCVDPIVIAAYLITQLQTVVSRTNPVVKPAVLTIGSIHGGETNNSIPEEVVMLGTLRSLYAETREKNLKVMEQITTQVCESMGAQGFFELSDRTLPPITNDEDVTEGIVVAAEQILGHGHVIDFKYPSMGSDDFAVFLNYSKGAQFFLGTGNNEDSASRQGLHQSTTIFDERSLKTGVAVLTQYTLNYLSGGIAYDE